jgi:signal transduction histidine kinase
MPLTRRTRLSLRLALASVVSAAAIATVCAVALGSLRNLAFMTREGAARQIALIDDTAAFQSLLYQKGFVAEYMLTGDRAWLEQLETSRRAFDGWLARSRTGAGSEEGQTLLAQIQRQYQSYDDVRRRAVVAFDAGRGAESKELLREAYGQGEQVRGLVQQFAALGREHAERRLADAEASTRRLLWLMIATSLLAAIASVLLGFMWARRVARPIDELREQVEAAAQQRNLDVSPGGDLDELTGEVRAIVRQLEDTDAELVEQRRRLIQSEKLSAVGEVAAKLAHEILNPLAGMKAAVQLMARGGPAAPDDVRETAQALDGEINRLAALVRRLVDYSKPLAPRVEVCPVSRLLDQALEAAQPELARHHTKVERADAAGLPPIEIDPLLMTQALTNLLTNAAQATPDGGTVSLRPRRAPSLGRDHVCIEVRDEGPGIAAANLPRLFHPFFTTKPQGHGLGLAVSQNIALEHGGRITAGNREDGHGARFELWVPLVR